jgi:hypothetical protein
MKTVNRPEFPRRALLNPAFKPNPINTGTRGDFGGSPVAFGAKLDNLVLGTTYNLDTGLLQPKTRSDYWIDEIRFTAYCSYTVNGSVPQVFTGLAGLLEAKLTTGSRAFSRDFISLGLHAPRFSFADSGEVPTQSVPGPNGRRRAFMNVRWPLPKPLFMNAGDAVQGLIQYRNLPFTSFGGTMPNVERLNVTYVGRLASPGAKKPLTRHVPWLAEFEKRGSNVYASTNDQFRNPFPDKDLYVQRFTSRTYRRDDSVLTGSFQEVTQFQGPAYGGGSPWAEARLFDSLGYAIVPDYTPINDVFDGVRGAWTFGRTLGPREQFDLQLRTQGTVSAGVDFFTQVGLVGFREEGV